MCYVTHVVFVSSEIKTLPVGPSQVPDVKCPVVCVTEQHYVSIFFTCLCCTCLAENNKRVKKIET